MLIIFDLDGTLVDSIHDLAVAASDLSERHGGTRFDDETVTRMVGEGAAVLVERIMARAGFPSPPAGALEEFLALYDEHMFDTTRAYPGVADVLRALADTHALAVLTNKPENASRKVLAHTELEGYFSHMVFGDGPFARKPDPSGLQWLMKRHRASARRTLLVGDSEVDLATARAGGVRICLARYGFGFIRVDPSTLDGRESFLDQPQDLLALLDEISERSRRST